MRYRLLNAAIIAAAIVAAVIGYQLGRR